MNLKTKIKIVGSGSAGNAVIVNDIILVDCGVPFVKLKEYLKNIKIILLTHIHGDHFNKSTLKKISEDFPKIRFACGIWLLNDLLKIGIKYSLIDCLSIGEIYDYNFFKISPIKLYHDVENCGYRIFINDEKIFYATDTKHLKGISAKNYNLYLVEANYGEEEIKKRIAEKMKNNEFCYELNVKNRHLSKEQCDEFLLKNMGKNSTYIYMHMHKEE